MVLQFTAGALGAAGMRRKLTNDSPAVPIVLSGYGEHFTQYHNLSFTFTLLSLWGQPDLQSDIRSFADLAENVTTEPII